MKSRTEPKLWELLSHNLGHSSSTPEFEQWRNAFALRSEPSTQIRASTCYSRINYRIAFILLLYELIYISFDDSLLSFQISDFFAFINMEMEALSQMFHQLGVSPLLFVRVGSHVVHLIGSCIADSLVLTFKIASVGVAHFLCPALAITSFFNSVLHIAPIALLIAISAQSLQLRSRKTVQIGNQIGKRALRKWEHIWVAKMMTGVTRVTALFLLQVVAGFLLRLLIIPSWIIQTGLCCLAVCCTEEESSQCLMVPIIACNYNRVSPIKFILFGWLASFCKMRPGEPGVHPKMLPLVIMHIALLLMTQCYYILLIFGFCLGLLQLIEALDAKCAHFKNTPVAKYCSFSGDPAEFDFRRLWDITLPIQPYN